MCGDPKQFKSGGSGHPTALRGKAQMSAPHRGGAMRSKSRASAVACRGAGGVDQVAEGVEAAAELAGGCEDRAAVNLHSGTIGIRGRRDQDVAAENLVRRRAARWLLPEVLDLRPPARPPERRCAPLEIIVGARIDLRVILDRVVAIIEVAGIPELRQVGRERGIVFKAEITGKLTDFYVRVHFQDDQSVVLPVGDAAATIPPGARHKDLSPVPFSIRCGPG